MPPAPAQPTSHPALAISRSGFAGIGTTNGDGAVIFGISDINNPWLVAMDPGNGNYKTFGGGPYNSQVLATGISSPAVWYNNYLYVVDNAGNLYCFDPNANLIKAQYFYAPTASDISSIAAANGDYIYAMENNHTKLGVFDEAGGSTPLIQEGGWGPGNGDTMYSPSLVDNGFFANIYLCGGMGNLYSIAFGFNLPNIVSSDGSGFVSPDGLFYGAEFTGTGLPPYSAVIADVGTDHLLAAWTNNAGQNNMGGIEYWTPVNLTTQASFTENQSTLSPITDVLPNATVYLIAIPSPLSGIQGVTYQDTSGPATWAPYSPASNGAMSPGKDNSQGYPSYWYVGPLTAPSTAGTYTMTVTATDESNQTATATATLTVQNTIQQGTATLVNGQYLQTISYGLPGGFDTNHDPRPCPYLTGNLYNASATQTKLGDNIQCVEDIPSTDILSKAPNPMPGQAHLDGINWGEWQVKYNDNGEPQLYVVDGTDTQTLNYPQGSMGPAPDYDTLINYVTSDLADENGSGGSGNMEAQFSFKENWAGYLAHGDNYSITTDPWNGKTTEDLTNPITGYTVSSQAWVTAIYEYDPPPPPQGSTPPPEYFPEAVQYNSTVPLEIIGTDDYAIPTVGGSELYEWY